MVRRKKQDKSKSKVTPKAPRLDMVSEITSRTIAGDLIWFQPSMVKSFRAPLKHDCYLTLSSYLLRVHSPGGEVSVLARKDLITSLKAAVRDQFRVSGQPPWVKDALGIK